MTQEPPKKFLRTPLLSTVISNNFGPQKKGLRNTDLEYNKVRDCRTFFDVQLFHLLQFSHQKLCDNPNRLVTNLSDVFV